jgi:hypothetical protein
MARSLNVTPNKTHTLRVNSEGIRMRDAPAECRIAIFDLAWVAPFGCEAIIDCHHDAFGIEAQLVALRVDLWPIDCTKHERSAVHMKEER